MQKMGKFSSNIRFLLRRGVKGGGSSFVQNHVSCGLRRELGEPVCQLTTCCQEQA